MDAELKRKIELFASRTFEEFQFAKSTSQTLYAMKSHMLNAMRERNIEVESKDFSFVISELDPSIVNLVIHEEREKEERSISERRDSSEYDSAKSMLIRQYGDRLGTFLVNRLAKMIRKRQATCLSHFRICEIGNKQQEEQFSEISRSGCCGSAEEIFEFKSGWQELWKSRKFKIGFNYGH